MVCRIIWTQCLDVQVSGSEDKLKIPLISEQMSPLKESEGRRVDKAVAVQTLYLLHCFGVSDEFYHELTQVCIYITSCNQVCS